MLLHVDPVCPVCHGVTALLALLEVPIEQRRVEHGQAVPGLEPPVLVLGEDRRLHGGMVVAQYLAERHALPAAWAEHPYVRGLQRQAIADWEAVVAPLFEASRDLDAGERAALDSTLDALAAVLRLGGWPRADLLALHVAPFWLQMRWLRDRSPVVPLIEAHTELASWLDAIADQPAVASTAPDREAVLGPRDGRPPR